MEYTFEELSGMHLCRNETNGSAAEVGSVFGFENYSTLRVVTCLYSLVHGGLLGYRIILKC
ncbi:hypothetical protein WH47_02325 [Habropoda laboriosa]|uniref:Uncharacterized protein n=1 Tax=Habropoda laboriosa TaxID=597456 RepID=A0A0L7QZE9_9HYME|nr:hypothetical protein WH47_02325 [Habropoda laboriosa]